MPTTPDLDTPAAVPGHPGVWLRPARTEDAQAMAALVQGYAADVALDPVGLTGLDAFYASVGADRQRESLISGAVIADVLVNATSGDHGDNEQLIGFIGIRQRMHVSAMFIDRAWQGRGLSSVLWQRARARLDAQTQAGDPPVWSLTVNASAAGLPIYQHWGFRRTGRDLYADGIRFTPMRLWLADPPLPQADDGRWAAQLLSVDDAPRLQAFFDANPLYFKKVFDAPAGPDDARSDLQELPPAAMPYSRQWTIGITAAADAATTSAPLIAYISVVADLLAPHVWHVGLFLVATAEHGTGLAQSLMRSLQAWALTHRGRYLRLGVVVGNRRGERFWLQQGFIETRQRHKLPYGALTQSVRTLVKPIAAPSLLQSPPLRPIPEPDDTPMPSLADDHPAAAWLPNYLAMLPRDRPQPCVDDVPALLPDSLTSELTAEPLTPQRWDDLETLFAARGCSVARDCWCMYYRRRGKHQDLQPGESAQQRNRQSLMALARAAEATHAPAPGLIGYRNGVPVGWISLGPRQDYVRLERSKVMKAADTQAVWSVICFVVPSEHRRQGVARALLAAAKRFARAHGATTLEAYPVDRTQPGASDAPWFGSKAMYDEAGFVEVVRNAPTRPLMRFSLR